MAHVLRRETEPNQTELITVQRFGGKKQQKRARCWRLMPRRWALLLWQQRAAQRRAAAAQHEAPFTAQSLICIIAVACRSAEALQTGLCRQSNRLLSQSHCDIARLGVKVGLDVVLDLFAMQCQPPLVEEELQDYGQDLASGRGIVDIQ